MRVFNGVIKLLSPSPALSDKTFANNGHINTATQALSEVMGSSSECQLASSHRDEKLIELARQNNHAIECP